MRLSDRGPFNLLKNNVINIINNEKHEKQQSVQPTVQPTEGRTHGRMDKASYRDAGTLKPKVKASKQFGLRSWVYIIYILQFIVKN